MQDIIAQRTREKASPLWYLPWKGQEQISGLVQMGGPQGPREGSLTAGLRNTRPPLLGPLRGHIWGGRGGNHSAHWKERALRVTRSVAQTPASSLCGPGYVTSPLNLLPCLQTRAGNCRVVDSLSWLGFLAWVTCSRIIRVVAVISLIKGRCDSGRRDSNTRALPWQRRVWLNTPVGTAESTHEQRLEDTCVPALLAHKQDQCLQGRSFQWNILI